MLSHNSAKLKLHFWANICSQASLWVPHPWILNVHNYLHLQGQKGLINKQVNHDRCICYTSVDKESSEFGNNENWWSKLLFYRDTFKSECTFWNMIFLFCFMRIFYVNRLISNYCMILYNFCILRCRKRKCLIKKSITRYLAV